MIMRTHHCFALLAFAAVLSTSLAAEPAAIAAVCADRQRVFASFHRSLYTQGIPGNAGSMWQLARRSGAQDSASFAECLASNDARRTVELETIIASRLGARGTPTFLDSRGTPVSLDQVLARD
jgi:protein-disulfide isomerase